MIEANGITPDIISLDADWTLPNAKDGVCICRSLSEEIMCTEAA